MARPAYRGTCLFCGGDFSKQGMSRHLAQCPKRMEILSAAEKDARTPETLYYLRVEAAYKKEYWLDFEVRGGGTLGDLDDYLRSIWFEHYDHLSGFNQGKGWDSELDMGDEIQQVFRPDVEITHTYDYGTSSRTLIRCLSIRTGVAATGKPIVLMARNRMPEGKCIKCEAPATFYGPECAYDSFEEGLLCAKHGKRHSHEGEQMAIPMVNSPRLGVDGYTGPAEPPY